MTLERYHEFLGRLFDGELAADEAEELAHGLRTHPEWRQDLLRQLVLWELWAQDVVPERGAAAFVAAWKIRVAAEADASEFQAAVQFRLAQQAEERSGPAWTAVCQWWRMLLRPAGVAGVVAAAFTLVFWLAVPHSTAAVVTLHGEAVCPACVLHIGHEHLPAIRVGHGELARIYYLETNSAVASLQERFCAGPTPAIVRGTLILVGTQERLAAETVALSPARPPPKGDQRVIFPL